MNDPEESFWFFPLPYPPHILLSSFFRVLCSSVPFVVFQSINFETVFYPNITRYSNKWLCFLDFLFIFFHFFFLFFFSFPRSRPSFSLLVHSSCERLCDLSVGLTPFLVLFALFVRGELFPADLLFFEAFQFLFFPWISLMYRVLY